MKISVVVFVTCLFLLFGLSCHKTEISQPPEVQMESSVVKLPEPKRGGNISLEETLAKRRSQRSFTSQNLSLEQISQLLWAAQGITEEASGKRTAPSAGALYPLELYLVSEEAVYHYRPLGHELEKTLEDDLRSQLCEAAWGQSAVEGAPIDIVITAVYKRTEVKYGGRAARYVHLEAGHAAQNIHLQAVALGLGSVPIGAFSDDRVQEVLSLPRDHKPLYIIPVGYLAR
jgi:SagB-type dehydrogenase family enzyme